jgi:hypothetical protein
MSKDKKSEEQPEEEEVSIELKVDNLITYGEEIGIDLLKLKERSELLEERQVKLAKLMVTGGTVGVLGLIGTLLLI